MFDCQLFECARETKWRRDGRIGADPPSQPNVSHMRRQYPTVLNKNWNTISVLCSSVTLWQKIDVAGLAGLVGTPQNRNRSVCSMFTRICQVKLELCVKAETKRQWNARTIPYCALFWSWLSSTPVNKFRHVPLCLNYLPCACRTTINCATNWS